MNADEWAFWALTGDVIMPAKSPLRSLAAHVAKAIREAVAEAEEAARADERAKCIDDYRAYLKDCWEGQEATKHIEDSVARFVEHVRERAGQG